MSEKSKEMWLLTAVVAVNLILLIIILSVVRADAVCLGSNGEKVGAVQKSLAEKGLYSGEISGEYDFATRKAVRIFQKQNGIDISGETDYKTLCLLELSARSGECFTVETELLARYLKLSGGASYREMLEKAEEIINMAGTAPITGYILGSSETTFEALLQAEPSSLAYAAALCAREIYF